MTRLTEKQLLLLTIGITVLISGGLGFLIWSDFRTIEEEKARKADLDRQIEAAEKEIAVRPDREYRVIANREISDKEVAFLPEEEEIETFWEVLERFGQDAGVRITEIAPSSIQRSGRDKKGAETTISTVPQVLSLRGSIDEFLRFINMIENYERIINVSEYSLTAGEAPDEDGKQRHAIRLALTTFTYSKKIASTIVSIPKYEEKREHPEVKKWLGRIKVQEKETYTLPPSLQRRDPFVSVRKRPEIGVSPVDGPADPAYQQGLIDNIVELVHTLQQGLSFEEELQRRGDLWRLTAQRKENREAYIALSENVATANKEITIPELRELFKKDVVVPWTAIQKRMEEMRNANPRLTIAQVQEWNEKISKLYDEQKWQEVETECRAFRDACKNGQHVEDDAKDLVQRIFELQRSAKVIDAFDKRKIQISTILFSPGGVSVAVINGKQMTVGDALDADGQVIVVEIGENFVIFETEGVEIKKMQTEK
ncbi:MAG TPA: type 4a pilus biogenesis protein PilO [Planctomycetota bacterium]|nr:type 4a pilus biogenesis protein PilO [Planctomycetota bacterium]